MSATASRLRSLGPELLWATFAIANAELMLEFPHYPTIPFHFIWISFTLFCGFRIWPRKAIFLVLLVVMAGTTGVLIYLTNRHYVDVEELAEVPLMAAVFLATMWHVWRGQAARDALEEIAVEERSQRRRELDFTRRASHELRTPLTVARGHVELVRQRLTDSGQVADLTTVIAELDRMALISKGLLALARMENPSTFLPTELDPVDLARGAARRWSVTCVRTWHVSCRSPMLLLDQERMSAALDALIDNAVKHTQAGDHIDISVTAGSGGVVVAVRDTGPGIPEAGLAHVFEPFWQAEHRRDRRYAGTGLGLAIVETVALQHGGSATAANAPGGGAVVSMTLPKSVLETNNELLFLRHDEDLEVAQVVPERSPL
ncbi:MAG: two-component system, OmpR family, sensor kinase [Frankiales bacterium]|nr:two-component system, OmpR family, sensor kinase [Frankiales bacterium]